MNEVTKAVVAKYNASELLTKREAVSKNIRDALQHRARDFGIVMEDTAITHLSFSREYTAAVEAKQVRVMHGVMLMFLTGPSSPEVVSCRARETLLCRRRNSPRFRLSVVREP